MRERHLKPGQFSLMALDPTAGAGAPALRAHMKTCTACQRLAALFQQVVDALVAAAPSMTLPRRLRDEVLSQIKRAGARRAPGNSRQMRR